MTAHLTPEQQRAYQHDGYVIVPDAIFPEDKFHRLKAHFEAKLAALPDGQRPEAMDVPHFTDPALFEWLLAPEVLDLIEPITGPDIALWSSHFICKPRGDGKRVPWHEDSAYWKGFLDPMNVVTVWLAIDPSTEENGCMRVVPGTHDNGFSDYSPVDTRKNVFSTEISRIEAFDRASVPCVLEPNHASLHDARLIHGSPANTSDQRRCGYTMRYMPTSVRFHPERMGGTHQIYLARGRDRAENEYANPERAYHDVERARKDSGKKYH